MEDNTQNAQVSNTEVSLEEKLLKVLNEPEETESLDLEDLEDPLTKREMARKKIGEIKNERYEDYLRFKDHPVIKKIVSLVGYSDSIPYIAKTIEKIDDLLSCEGKSYKDVFSTLIYSDAPDSNLAFLLHVETTFKTDIMSCEQLQKLTGIEDYEDLKDSYIMAAEERYSLFLEKILRSNGKFKDLQATDPSQFGLPPTWKSFSTEYTKQTLIQKAIALYYQLMEPIYFRPLSLSEIADHIQAPLSEVIKAAKYEI